MALRACRECSKPVGRGADACPHCGATSPWLRKNPRRGNDALWVCGTLVVGLLVILALSSCGSTGPGDQGGHVPQLGRYDFQVQAPGTAAASGDLVITSASSTTLVYRFYMPGVFSSSSTTVYGPGSWSLAALLSGQRAATVVMTRIGSSYSCSATVVLASGPVPGACSLTFEGPDSVRTAP